MSREDYKNEKTVFSIVMLLNWNDHRQISKIKSNNKNPKQYKVMKKDWFFVKFGELMYFFRLSIGFTYFYLWLRVESALLWCDDTVVQWTIISEENIKNVNTNVTTPQHRQRNNVKLCEWETKQKRKTTLFDECRKVRYSWKKTHEFR